MNANVYVTKADMLKCEREALLIKFASAYPSNCLSIYLSIHLHMFIRDVISHFSGCSFFSIIVGGMDEMHRSVEKGKRGMAMTREMFNKYIQYFYLVFLLISVSHSILREVHILAKILCNC